MFIVGIREGQSIQIGDQRITALSVIRPGVVELAIEGEPEPTLISWDRKLELFPNVKVTVDRSVCYSTRIKLFFEAPRSIRIRELPYDPATQHNSI